MTTEADLQQRTEEIFQTNLREERLGLNRHLLTLMGIQWLGCLLLAAGWSLFSWQGRTFAPHLHVYYAIFGGGLLFGTTYFAIRVRPDSAETRAVAAVMQVLWSTLIIHLTGGRIESHFHIFGSLAFLAFYRDRGLLAVATLAIVADHLARGIFAPESIYGSPLNEWWRFLEHAGWVVFEDIVLFMGIGWNLAERRRHAATQAHLEKLKIGVEEEVVARTHELETSRAQYRSLVEESETIPFQFDMKAGALTYVAPQFAKVLGCSPQAWNIGAFWASRVHPEDWPRLEAWTARTKKSEASDFEFRMRHEDGHWIWLRSVTKPPERAAGPAHGILLDVTKRHQLEMDLAQAQKLESVGRLASGVAHELNTPIQFVSDNVHFLKESSEGLLQLLGFYEDTLQTFDSSLTPAQRKRLKDAKDTADLDYVQQALPKSFAACLDGLGRAAGIVRAMKEFAHPDQRTKAPADINHALDTTLTIAKNEYKYVADVVTNYGELPPVFCQINELNQVFLNLIVNASHAISDRSGGGAERGKITITTRTDAEEVCISIADTGAGIPDAIREKIFEPFFTTKAVGRGTGQGLAIAHNVVVEKHHGKLTFDTQLGQGTTFHVRLPLASANAQLEAA